MRISDWSSDVCSSDLFAERAFRGRARFHNTTGRNRSVIGQQLTGMKAFAAIIICLVPLTFGFLLPAGILLHMAFTSGDAQFGARFLQLAGNSFTLSAVTALAAVMIALLLAYVARTSRRRLPNWINRIAGLGYETGRAHA